MDKKLAGVVLLIAGMLSNSALASAEGPIPFSSLEQAASAQPNAPLSGQATGNSSPVSTQPIHRKPMAPGGKIFTGLGIGLVGLGGALIISAAKRHPANPYQTVSGRGADFAVGAASAGIGTLFIIAGVHWRSSK
jgi:hypothetical protein